MVEDYKPVLINDGYYILVGAVCYGNGWTYDIPYNHRAFKTTDTRDYLSKSIVVI